MNADGTNLWDCGNCATQRIAAGLTYCPNCRMEKEMPAVNRQGHSTVFGEPNEAQKAAMMGPVGITPPKPAATEEEATGEKMVDPKLEEEAKIETAAELVAAGYDPEAVKEVVGLSADTTVPETASDPIAQATEKASQAKEAFSSGDKNGALALLDEAIALDPTRAEKWTKLKDQVIGSGEQW